jgi:hypothetical protein
MRKVAVMSHFLGVWTNVFGTDIKRTPSPPLTLRSPGLRESGFALHIL